jgi:hypothetical protein
MTSQVWTNQVAYAKRVAEQDLKADDLVLAVAQAHIRPWDDLAESELRVIPKDLEQFLERALSEAPSSRPTLSEFRMILTAVDSRFA